ncbi:MAG: glycosyltransferase family 2 protein [Candidatus Omnitrophica bacterium]|nr:glycosyltransferase family 2 protein [Candidatus Omnitrophota bacterium]
MKSPQFSLVVPVLNEKDSLRSLLQEINAVMQKQAWSYEVLCIDDGSTDGTPDVLRSLSRENSHMRLFMFDNHRGKSAALACGFQNARGAYVVTLDGDLQDTPEEIVKLWNVMEARKADLVSGWKKIRNDPWHKVASSRLFNALVRCVTGVKLHDFNCGLKIYRAKVVREIPLYGELHRFTPALAAWKGFRVTEEPILHRPRQYGKSKFGFGRMFGMTVDLLTVAFLMRYEGKPSHLFSGAGFIFLLVGGFINLQLFIKKLFGGTISPHYPYMILGITLLLIGVQFVFFGLLSEMVLYFSRRQEQMLDASFPAEEGKS